MASLLERLLGKKKKKKKSLGKKVAAKATSGISKRRKLEEQLLRDL